MEQGFSKTALLFILGVVFRELSRALEISQPEFLEADKGSAKGKI